MSEDRSVVPVPESAARDIVRRALEEDVPWGDITSDVLVAPNIDAEACFLLKEPGTICGLRVAAMVFEEVDPSAQFSSVVADGERLQPGTVLARVHGSARSILMAERTALNLLQRMSGIATATNAFVHAVAGTGACILDTRKTVPGLRVLDKYAVRCGGGSNHRFSLSDGVLIKDNHLAASDDGTSETLARRVQRVRSSVPHTTKVEVEVDRLDQIEEVLAGGADIVLLDNMDPAMLRAAVDLVGGRAITEASGGIALDTVRAVAESGVDLISVGALTHSVRALDIGLDLQVSPARDSDSTLEAAV